jgi:hypothetical protein
MGFDIRFSDILSDRGRIAFDLCLVALIGSEMKICPRLK